jgi:hypothetical protein
MKDGTSLCQNSGVPPRTTISYAGLAEIAAKGESRGSRVVYSTPVRFEIPDGLAARVPTTILRRLGQKPGPDPTAQLRHLIEERAAELPLPDGCAVMAAAPGHISPWPDALSGLAVVTKCSNSVWLRAKSPLLGPGCRRGWVSLLVPPAFAAAIPGVIA